MERCKCGGRNGRGKGIGSDARVVGEKTGKDWRVMNIWWEERRKKKVEETDIPVVGEKNREGLRGAGDGGWGPGWDGCLDGQTEILPRVL